MIRGTWVWDRQKRELVPKHLYREPPPKRSSLPSPMVISDSLADVVNPVNGKRYNSKSAYYKAVRAAGCEIVGNEQQKQCPPQIDDPTKDIVEAMQKVKQGYKPPPRRANG